jgi:hypothetical protein
MARFEKLGFQTVCRCCSNRAKVSAKICAHKGLSGFPSRQRSLGEFENFSEFNFRIAQVSSLHLWHCCIALALIVFLCFDLEGEKSESNTFGIARNFRLQHRRRLHRLRDKEQSASWLPLTLERSKKKEIVKRLSDSHDRKCFNTFCTFFTVVANYTFSAIITYLI